MFPDPLYKAPVFLGKLLPALADIVDEFSAKLLILATHGLETLQHGVDVILFEVKGILVVHAAEIAGDAFGISARARIHFRDEVEVADDGGANVAGDHVAGRKVDDAVELGGDVVEFEYAQGHIADEWGMGGEWCAGDGDVVLSQ